MKNPNAITNRQKWDLIHKLINTVRSASGMPLSKEVNPYLKNNK